MGDRVVDKGCDRGRDREAISVGKQDITPRKSKSNFSIWVSNVDSVKCTSYWVLSNKQKSLKEFSL